MGGLWYHSRAWRWQLVEGTELALFACRVSWQRKLQRRVLLPKTWEGVNYHNAFHPILFLCILIVESLSEETLALDIEKPFTLVSIIIVFFVNHIHSFFLYLFFLFCNQKGYWIGNTIFRIDITLVICADVSLRPFILQGYQLYRITLTYRLYALCYWNPA